MTMTVPASDLTFWSYLHKKMIVENGTYRIEIGRSSADIACSATAEIGGTWDAPLATVYVTGDRQVLGTGERAQVKTTATLLDTTHLCMCEHKPVYESTDPSVITVDSNGTVTAVGAGAASVVATVTYHGVGKSRKLAFAVV